MQTAASPKTDTAPIRIINKIATTDTVAGVPNTHVCHICGRISLTKRTRDGKPYCAKHYKQEWRHGCILDHNPRTTNDLNEIRVYDAHAELDLYDRLGNVVATALVDPNQVDKIASIKWCLGTQNYVITNRDANGKRNSLHRVVTSAAPGVEVDHIDHNVLDNRLSNLRLVTHATNVRNPAKRPLGITLRKNGTWLAHITHDNCQIHLGLYRSRAEALYARHYAETLLDRAASVSTRAIDIYPTDAQKAAIRAKVEHQIQTNLKRHAEGG